MRTAGWAGILCVAATTFALAQVPVTREPHHRVVFENARLRILEVTVPPQGLTLAHRHDRDIATVSIGSADTRTIAPGQPWGPVRPRRPVGDASTTEYAGRPGTHAIENVGDTPYRLVAVENLREEGWSTTAPLIAGATTLAIESRAFRVYNLTLGAGDPLTRHVHAQPVVMVLASGRAAAEGPSTSRQLDEPGQWLVIAPGESHHVSAGGDGAAHVVEIEVR